MHAYAADDPVFRAMNKRGQRLTNNALGSFCVNCHAPMAVHEGATKNGTDLATVPGHDGTDRPVVCRRGPVLVSSFHPELSGDLRMHELFLKGC